MRASVAVGFELGLAGHGPDVACTVGVDADIEIGTARGDMDDIEAIKQLKARYFRMLDTKDWDGSDARRRDRGVPVRE